MATPTEVAGRYRVDRRLGAGGMSTVFLATDSVLERPVAVKLLAEHLAEDEDFVARFRREALAAARLQHPNVVQVFDSGEDAELAPPLHRHGVRGRALGADMLRDHKQLELDEAVAIVRDACHGLDYAHRAGVVHRDVKPGNLLVADETHTTKLADFGIAKAVAADAHHPGRLGAGHRRLPVARAGARRGGRARRRTSTRWASAPTSSWPGGCRTSTRRSPSWRSSSRRSRWSRSRCTGPRCRRSSTARSACAWRASPRPATPPRWRWRRRWTPAWAAT